MITYTEVNSGGIINVTYAELYNHIINSTLVAGNSYRITDYKCVNYLNGNKQAQQNPVSVNPNFNPREIYTSPIEEKLVFQAISSNELAPQGYSETNLGDIVEYMPYCNKIGTLADIFNGDGYGTTSLALQWDGSMVYFEMPVAFPVYFGHTFVFQMTFLSGLYNISCVYDPIKPSITFPTTSQGTYSTRLQVVASSGNIRVNCLDLDNSHVLTQDLDSMILVTLDTSLGIQDAYGCITRRTDTLTDISTPFDFRYQKFRRFLIDLNSVNVSFATDYNGIGNSTMGVVTQPTYQDFTTFNATTRIGNIKWEGRGAIFNNFYTNSGSSNNNVFNGTEITNLEFSENTYDNTVHQANMRENKYDRIFFGNIFLGGGYNNIFDRNCFFNIIGNNCDHNRIGVGFGSNSFGDGFSNNVFGIGCSNNIGNLGFSYNIIGDGFDYNVTLGDFTNNKIGHSFIQNNIGYTCQYNTFRNSTYTNTIGDSFTNNIVGSNFGNNVFAGSGFDANTFGEWCSNNTIQGGFGQNKMGDYFQSNSTQNGTSGNVFGLSCQGNTLGNSFTSNKCGDDFNSNTIGNNCQDNEIASTFQGNNIGTDFKKNVCDLNFVNNGIGNFCISNNFGLTVMNNTILDNFQDNSCLGSFNNNQVGNNCKNNSFGVKTEINNFCFVSGGYQQNTNGSYCSGNDFGTSPCLDNSFGNLFVNNTFTGAYYQGNSFGNECRDNAIGGDFVGNVIGNQFKNNTIVGYFQYNKIGSNTVGNTVGSSFAYNVVSGQMQSCTIGDVCQNNNIPFNFTNNITGNNFRLVTMSATLSGTNFTAATHVRSGYSVNIFIDSTFTHRLAYFNGATMVYVSPTS